MKNLSLILGMVLLNAGIAEAALIECSGQGSVTVAGSQPRSEAVSVKIDLVREVMIYQGPHGSVSLPSDAPFELRAEVVTAGGQLYFYSDASTSGHGGERNRFFLEAFEADLTEAGLATTTRKFFYNGSYDYIVEATALSCTRTN
jgi:hypothetical protein